LYEGKKKGKKKKGPNLEELEEAKDHRVIIFRHRIIPDAHLIKPRAVRAALAAKNHQSSKCLATDPGKAAGGGRDADPC